MSKLSWHSAQSPSPMLEMLDDVDIPYELMLEFSLRCCEETAWLMSDEQCEVFNRVRQLGGIDDELCAIREQTEQQRMAMVGKERDRNEEIVFWLHSALKSLLQDKADYQESSKEVQYTDLARVYYSLVAAIDRFYAFSASAPPTKEASEAKRLFADILRQVIPAERIPAP